MQYFLLMISLMFAAMLWIVQPSEGRERGNVLVNSKVVPYERWYWNADTAALIAHGVANDTAVSLQGTYPYWRFEARHGPNPDVLLPRLVVQVLDDRRSDLYVQLIGESQGGRGKRVLARHVLYEAGERFLVAGLSVQEARNEVVSIFQSIFLVQYWDQITNWITRHAELPYPAQRLSNGDVSLTVDRTVAGDFHNAEVAVHILSTKGEAGPKAEMVCGRVVALEMSEDTPEAGIAARIELCPEAGSDGAVRGVFLAELPASRAVYPVELEIAPHP